MLSNFSFGSTDTPVTATILEALTVTAQVAVLPPSLVVTVILAVPAATAVTLPSSTVATLELSDIHLTLLSAASVGITVAVRVNSSPILIALVVSLSVTPVTFFTAFVGLQDDKAINIAAIVSSPKLKTFFIIYFLYFFQQIVISVLENSHLFNTFYCCIMHYIFGIIATCIDSIGYEGNYIHLGRVGSELTYLIGEFVGILFRIFTL